MAWIRPVQGGFTGPTPPPGSGSVSGYIIPYAFNDASPLQIVAALNPGEYVMRADVQVEITFDDPTAVAELGVPSDPDGILNALSIDTQNTGFYRTLDPFTVGAAEAVELTITPGVSTQGSGFVFVEVWAP